MISKIINKKHLIKWIIPIIYCFTYILEIQLLQQLFVVHLARVTLIEIQLKCRHAQDQALRIVNLRYNNAFKVDFILIEDTRNVSARFV